MKKKAKKAPINKIPQPDKIEVIPPDLKLKWDGVIAVATAFSTLDKGYFPHSYAAIVKQSLVFLSKLHENMVNEALKHPQAHMIPELKEVIKENKQGKVEMETANGEQTAQN